jgi:peptidoglycan/LPS O-acetylase OafA/YrhL
MSSARLAATTAPVSDPASAGAGAATAASGARPGFLKGHLPALDGIRGVAVLSVMVYHFFGFGGMGQKHVVDDIAFHGVMLGWTGVELFFVLSGFLITGILLDARGKPGFFRTFYARRSIRIFPLYFMALLLTYGVLRPLFPGNADLRATHEGHPLWFWLYGSNILTAIGGWPAVPRILQHFWSLAIEEQFYLVWPFLVYFLSRRTMLRLCVAIIAVGLAVRIYLHAHGLDLAAYVLTPARMDGLATGAALAIALRDPSLLPRLQRWAIPVLGGSAAALVGMILWRGGLPQFDRVVGTIGFTLVGVLFAGVLFTAVVPGSAISTKALFERPTLRFFGKYSYALYVFHQPVALGLTAMGFSVASFPRVAGSMLPGGIAFTLIAGAISVALALISWNLFEKRFLQLKERFSHDAAERAHRPVVAPHVTIGTPPARAELAMPD